MPAPPRLLLRARRGDVELEEEAGSVEAQTDQGQVAECAETAERWLLVHRNSLSRVHGQLARTVRSLMPRQVPSMLGRQVTNGSLGQRREVVEGREPAHVRRFVANHAAVYFDPGVCEELFLLLEDNHPHDRPPGTRAPNEA